MLFPSLIAALIARYRAHRAEKRRRELKSRQDRERLEHSLGRVRRNRPASEV